MQTNITQWSFSRLKDYRTCPAKARYKHVLKMKEPGNAAMDRGLEVHKQAEQVARGQIPPPPIFSRFKDEFKDLAGRKIIAEEKWALTRQWKPTGFFDKDVFLRLVLDCAYLIAPKMVIIDYKTGKVYPDHEEQLSLYALGGFSYFSDVKEITAAMWYIDSPKAEKLERTYKLKELPALKKYWLAETKAMLRDTTFAPLPGNYCRWCHFRKENNGPCQY